MKAIQSNRGPSAIEYVLIALSVTLLLSVYLAGGLAFPDNTRPRTLLASMRNQNTLRFAVEGPGESAKAKFSRSCRKRTPSKRAIPGVPPSFVRPSERPAL
jgi:hypothetical protein